MPPPSTPPSTGSRARYARYARRTAQFQDINKRELSRNFFRARKRPNSAQPIRCARESLPARRGTRFDLSLLARDEAVLRCTLRTPFLSTARVRACGGPGHGQAKLDSPLSDSRCPTGTLCRPNVLFRRRGSRSGRHGQYCTGRGATAARFSNNPRGAEGAGERTGSESYSCDLSRGGKGTAWLCLANGGCVAER